MKKYDGVVTSSKIEPQKKKDSPKKFTGGVDPSTRVKIDDRNSENGTAGGVVTPNEKHRNVRKEKHKQEIKDNDVCSRKHGGVDTPTRYNDSKKENRNINII